MYLDRLAALISGGFLLAEGDEEQPGAGGTAAGDAGATEGAGEGNILAGGATDDGAGAAADENKSGWPEDWRERLANGDEAQLRNLKRYGSVDGLWKKNLNLEKALSDRSQHRAVPALAEDAKPEEVAAYRKAAGIPETPDGYGLAFPEEYKATDADKEVLGGFAQFMHERNQPPAAAKAAFEYLMTHTAQVREAQAEAAQQAVIENMAELRKTFTPTELRKNEAMAEDLLQRHFGGDHETLRAITEVMNLRLPNGVRVQDYAPFKRGLYDMAAAYATEGAMIAGDAAGGGGRSLDEEKKALLTKSATGRLTREEDTRLTQIYETLTAREARNQRTAA